MPITRRVGSEPAESHGRGTFLVIVFHMINANARGIAPHLVSVVGLQQVGHRTNVGHVRIKPQIIAVWSRMTGMRVNSRSHRVRRRCQNRTGLNPLPAGVFPTIPKSSERKQLPVVDFKAVWLFTFRRPLPLVETVCRGIKPQRISRLANPQCRSVPR